MPMNRPEVEILLVEGHESDAELYRRILGRYWPAVRLTWVKTLHEALERLATRKPTAMLLDLQLPDSSGLHTIAKVYAESSNVPIVVLTQYCDESLGNQAIRMGAQDYLAKISTTGDVLVRCLRSAIHRQRLVSSIRSRDSELAHRSRLITIGEMASCLAHELKQPLTAIKNYAEASINRLKSGTTEDNTQKVIDNLTSMSQQASHASDILRHMKNFTQKSGSHAQAESLDEIVCDCLALLDHEVRRDGVDIILQLDAQLPQIWVDRIQMTQVMLNLIRNSMEAVSASGLARREITLRTFAENDTEAAIVVSDSGPGFAPRVEAGMFEPFYSTKQGGTGMGLSICRSIVEAHGGRIHAANKEGGAEFRVVLPLAVTKRAMNAEIPVTTTENFHDFQYTDLDVVEKIGSA
jgi:signal transduction histidine kinase